MERYLVIVSRDRPEVVQRLLSTYGQRPEIEIRLDRRAEHHRGNVPTRRAPGYAPTDFEPQGFIVIPRHERAYQAAGISA